MKITLELPKHAVISSSIAVVFALVADLMIPPADDYIALTTCVTVIGDMGRTLTVVVLTGVVLTVVVLTGVVLTVVVLTCFNVLSQQLFGGTKEKHENCQIYCRYLRWDSIFTFELKHQRFIFKRVIYSSDKICIFHVTVLLNSEACSMQ